MSLQEVTCCFQQRWAKLRQLRVHMGLYELSSCPSPLNDAIWWMRLTAATIRGQLLYFCTRLTCGYYSRAVTIRCAVTIQVIMVRYVPYFVLFILRICCPGEELASEFSPCCCCCPLVAKPSANMRLVPIKEVSSSTRVTSFSLSTGKSAFAGLFFSSPPAIKKQWTIVKKMINYN